MSAVRSVPPVLLATAAVLLVGSLLIAGPLGGAPAIAGSAHPTGDRAPTLAASPASPPSAMGLGWVTLITHTGQPLTRAFGSMAFDAADGYTILFGGCSHTACPLGDTWRYAASSWTNLSSTLATAPSPRDGASMVYDAHDGYLLLFGGLSANGTLGDTWKFAGGTWAIISTSGNSTPSPRSFAQVTYLASSGSVVLFGGRSESGTALSDAWTFSSGTWAPLATGSSPTPSARFGGVFANDPSTGAAILFGGSGACGTFCGETWAFSAQGWTNLTATAVPAPAGRTGTTFTYDPGRSTLVLFGGTNGTSLSDTWGFAGGAWHPMTAGLTGSPGARNGSQATFDPLDGYLLLFGGFFGPGARYPSWVLVSPLVASIQTPSLTVAPGVAVDFSSVLSGGLPPYLESWQFGDGSASVSSPSASHTFAIAGTFNVLLSVQDSAADFTSAQVTLAVHLTPLNVSIIASAPNVSLGGSVRFTAAISGGVSPFVYAWSAPASLCGATGGSTLVCTPLAAGPLSVAVAVSDSSGQRATTGLAVTVMAPPSGPTSSTGPRNAGAVNGPMNAQTLAIEVAVTVLLIGLTTALLSYLDRRRRTRVRPPIQPPVARPLCYAVPAWSETPPDYTPAPISGLPIPVDDT